MIKILFQGLVIKRQLADSQDGQLQNPAFEFTLHRLPLWIRTSHLAVPPKPALGHLVNAGCNHFSASQSHSLVCMGRGSVWP